MTHITITPNTEKKRLRFSGDAIAAGEHVNVTVVGFADKVDGGNLRLRVISCDCLVALFPHLSTDEWTVDEDGNAVCELNLNSIQLKKATRCGGCEFLFVLDDVTVPQKYGAGDLFIGEWRQEPGADEPYNLDRYPDIIHAFGERLDAFGVKVNAAKDAAVAASNSAVDARNEATSAGQSAAQSFQVAAVARTAAEVAQLSAREAQEAVAGVVAALPTKADLVGGKVPSSQLPSYVDDVLEFDSYEDFPASGESGKIYIAKDKNRQYRWSGTQYVEIGSGEDTGAVHYYAETKTDEEKAQARGNIGAMSKDTPIPDVLGKLPVKALPKYLHALAFDDTYPADAEWLYEQLGPSDIGRCSAVRRGGKLCRNYDWTFDSSASFAVRVSGNASRFASVGMASVGSRLNENDVASGVYSRYYKCLPGMTLDGINERGVVAEINVDCGPKTGWHGTGENALHILAAVRWVLDHGVTAGIAAEYIAFHVKQPTGEMNFHFMIADAEETWIVENGSAWKVNPGPASVPAMTNFPLDHTPYSGAGLERFLHLFRDLEDIRTMWFTNAYQSGNDWDSDFESAEEHASAIAQWAAQGETKEAHRGKTTSGGKAWWQTVHTTEYDFAAKTMKVAVQEVDDWFTFAVDANLTEVAWSDITGKPTSFPPTAHAATHKTGGSDALTPADIGAVAAVPGKGLSTNDYTTAEKSKLAGIEAGAEVNPTPVAPSTEIADGAFADAAKTAAFVNSSINAMAAFYITKNAAGDAFATKAELTAAIASGTFYNGGQPRTPTKNDYLYVLADESATPIIPGVAPTTRYSYDGAQWAFQIIVNNTALTSAQVAAINSGITAALVAWLSAFKGGDTSTTLASVLAALAGKLDKSGGEMTVPIYGGYKIKFVGDTGGLNDGIAIVDSNGYPVVMIGVSSGTLSVNSPQFYGGNFEGSKYSIQGGRTTLEADKITHVGRSFNFPSNSGTFALLSDLAAYLADNTADYSASATYAVGAFVKYSGALYVCKTAITTAEAWTPAHWTAMPNVSSLFSTANTSLMTAIENKVNTMFDDGETEEF